MHNITKKVSWQNITPESAKKVCEQNSQCPTFGEFLQHIDKSWYSFQSSESFIIFDPP